MWSDAAQPKTIRPVAMLVLFGMLAALVLWCGTGKVLGTKDGGYGRLVSFAPLPEEFTGDGEMCKFVPASAATSLVAALTQEQESATAAARAAEPRPTDAAKLAAAQRKPVRAIQDPNPAFSAVALDLGHDEVVLQDENTFGINIYNRLDNTPPTARMTEPKRSIRGENTQMDFNCNVYVDPSNGDIYSANNDTLGILTVFSHAAKGDAAPKRMLQTGILYGVAVDEERQEMYFTGGGSVVVYKKSATGRDRPIRRIAGNQTQMAESHGMALDPKRGLIFVENWGSGHKNPPRGSRNTPEGEGGGGEYESYGGVPGSGYFNPPSITVYPKDAQGDVAPLRVIQGPKTQLSWPTAIAVDPEHGELFVARAF